VRRLKIVCIPIGARNNTECAPLSLAQGELLQWVSDAGMLTINASTLRRLMLSFTKLDVMPLRGSCS